MLPIPIPQRNIIIVYFRPIVSDNGPEPSMIKSIDKIFTIYYLDARNTVLQKFKSELLYLKNISFLWTLFWIISRFIFDSIPQMY